MNWKWVGSPEAGHSHASYPWPWDTTAWSAHSSCTFMPLPQRPQAVSKGPKLGVSWPSITCTPIHDKVRCSEIKIKSKLRECSLRSVIPFYISAFGFPLLVGVMVAIMLVLYSVTCDVVSLEKQNNNSHKKKQPRFKSIHGTESHFVVGEGGV